jgi:long-chain acyl-CoA synthetase
MQNFYRRFLESSCRWPDNIAVELRHSESSGGAVESYTYTDLRRMAESVGCWLGEQGMPAGARAALLAANGPRWVAAYLGIVAAGGVAVPFDTAFNEHQVRRLLEDSGTGCVFTDHKHLPVAQKAAEGLDVLLVLLDGKSEVELAGLDAMFEAGPGDFVPADPGPDDPAVILYTSGTTSDPRGVLLAHDNLLGEMDAVFPVLDIFPTDAILGVLPLFHALAQMANLLLPFAVGARVVYLESLSAAEIVRALRESKITIFVCVPQFFYMIHERIMKEVAKRGRVARMLLRVMMAAGQAGRRVGLNLGKLFFKKAHEALGTSIRLLVTGGSRFDPAVGRDLQAMGFEILQAYGLTETSGGAVVTRPGHNVMGSVGRPLHGVEVKIVGGERREDGQVEGEIAIRGRIVMRGYWNNPEATAEVLRDGWLHTGDLGYIDESGDLYISGRRREIIVLSSGKNIYPEELEAHYMKSPFVKEICVVGLEGRAGEARGERLHGVIVPNYEVMRERKIVNARDVIRFDIEGLSAQLPSTKRILSYELWQSPLPRTTTRKLKRYEILRQVLTGGQQGEAQSATRQLTEEVSTWLADPVVARAMAVIKTAAKNRESVLPSDNLELDLGLDSVERVQLLVALESELQTHLPESVASEVYTVREMVDAVRSAARASGPTPAFEGWEKVLATESTDPDVLALGRPRRFWGVFWFVVAQLLNLFCRDRYRMKVEGLDKLPDSGPFLICPNHQSFLDAPVVLSLLPWRLFKDTFHLGTSEIWGWGWRRKFARTFNLIPVDPDSNLVAGMRAGAFGLRRGKVLILYPEGERSIDGVPKVFKKGAAILATHLRVPIYPAALDGFYEAWPRGKPPQKFSQLRIRIGDPIAPPESPGSDPEATYEWLNGQLRARVVKMWEEIHAESPAEETRSRAAAAD